MIVQLFYLNSFRTERNFILEKGKERCSFFSVLLLFGTSTKRVKNQQQKETH